jgi:GYF domain 2
MAVLFNYSHDAAEFGPFSAGRMRELAAAGAILATDLVWQQGTEQKVAAARVKNLFPPRQPNEAAEQREAARAAAEAAAEAAVFPPMETAEPKKPLSEAARPKRVIRIKGGVILSQDGRYVSFMKHCTVCGHKESSRSSALIRVGTTRLPFFCRPCRRGRVVELQGVT